MFILVFLFIFFFFDFTLIIVIMKRKFSILVVVLVIGLTSLVGIQNVLAGSGGPGATECSSNYSFAGFGWGNSVTCGEGSYAKCGLFRARCVEEEA
jgi:hypothetical protein